jgi:hypothetical protein
LSIKAATARMKTRKASQNKIRFPDMRTAPSKKGAVRKSRLAIP